MTALASENQEAKTSEEESRTVVIRARDLTKAYGEDLLAVDHVSFSVREGEIFGFLGLNGAGKTTTIKMLASLILPTSGSIKIFGLDPSRAGLEIRRRLGVVQQQESYDRNLTLISSLRLYASLWRIPREEAEKKIDSLLERFDLREVRTKKIRWLSFGQRRRLQVAREFIHDASLLILDEPTVGMDVLARRSFLDYCKERAQGTTIFYTTHIISEAEYLCDRVALIHRGKIIALDSPKELKKRYGEVKSVSVSLQSSSDLKKVQDLLSRGGASELQSMAVEERGTTELRLASKDPYKLAFDISSLLSEERIEPESISVTEPSLEQVMVRLLGGEKKTAS